MLLSTLILAILFVTCTAIAQDSPRDAIELYFQAHAFGNGDHIRQVFAPDAKIRSSVVQTYLLLPAPPSPCARLSRAPTTTEAPPSVSPISDHRG